MSSITWAYMCPELLKMDNLGLSGVPLILFFILLFLFASPLLCSYALICLILIKNDVISLDYLAPLFPAFLRIISSAYLMPFPL